MNEQLASRGPKMAGGTIVDSTIIAAPSSTKNEAKARNPPAAEGSAVVFRDEAAHRGGHKTKLIHSMETNAVHVHDARVLGELLHGNETGV